MLEIAIPVFLSAQKHVVFAAFATWWDRPH